MVSDSCACVQLFALYVYFQSIPQEYLRYPYRPVTSFIFNREYMTVGPGRPSI